MIVDDLDFNDKRVQQFLAAQESQDIAWGDEFRMDVLELIKHGDKLQGITLPWGTTHDKVRLGPGEVSVWAGKNGSFKSAVLGQVAVHVAKSHPVGIASFEMPVKKTLQRMIWQAAGTQEPAMRWANDFMTWTHNKIAFYNRLDMVPANRVLACVLYMAEKLGCKLVMVDSLMMVSGVGGDMDNEKKFMGDLCSLAKVLGIHIALVHHVKKPSDRQGSNYIPDRYAIKGNGAIIDLASLAVMVWADEDKDALKGRLDFGDTLTPDEQDYYTNSPDQILKIVKHRNGEFKGKIPLWRHPSMQFTADSSRRPFILDIPRLEAVS